ncbi:MAG TPA: DUF3047 domain-containing protein, partial [Candidatus Bathyarchaeia archaeon]|nr:DUF3047 domain-containing protein [Candidatus Bathyarchaeia archaeon]
MVASRPLITLRLALSLVVLAVPGTALATDCVALEDFSAGRIGEFPPDWKPRQESGRLVYTLAQESGARYLHAASRGLGVQAGRELAWNLDVYPILAWSWRPVEFPANSDERNSKTNDSALAVYAVFPGSMVSVKSVKYVWSRLVPTGTHLTSSAGNTQVQVLRSGTAQVGQWVDEQVNVREDYRKYFGVTEVPKPAGIAVL